MAFQTINESKKSSQGYVNLKKQTTSEIKELLQRQENLLLNRSFISKLPDKGEKIRKFKQTLEDELKKREDVDSAAELLTKLNLTQLPVEIEWNNDISKQSIEKTKLDVNGDHEDTEKEIDVLKIIATHSGTMPSRINKTNQEYSTKLCEKFDHLRNKPSTKFKPNEPKVKDEVVTGYKKSAESVQRKLGKHWEVTAAITPVPVYGDTKMLTLSDSLNLQKAQAAKLKTIQIEEAVERLKRATTIAKSSDTSLVAKNSSKYGDTLKNQFEGSSFTNYQETNEGDSDSETGGAVFYNLIDDEVASTL